MRVSLTAVLVAAAAAISGPDARGADAVPQGPGLAARFPFDRGIKSHPSVLLHETFEDGIGRISSRWTQVKNKDGKVLSVSGEKPPASGGRQSLQMHSVKGRDTGGHLWQCFKPGVDTMYGRFYVKFSKDHPYVHHFVKIGAWRGASRWPAGEAGYRHDGSKSFQTGIEPGSGWGKNDPPGGWFLYTYWCEMRTYDPNKRVYYGNAFAPQKPCQIPRDRWQCVEFMVKANDAPKSDGEQAFWVDGRLIGRWAPGTPTGSWKSDKYRIGGGEPFKGYKWRTTNDLKINTFWLLYYQEAVWRGSTQFKKKPNTSETEGTVWFDDVVVATEYIGPIVAQKAAQKKPSGGIIAPPKIEKKTKADPKKEAELRAKLVAVIRDKAASEKPAIYIDFAGRATRAKLVSADDDGVKVSMRGMAMPLAWEKIKSHRLYGMASKLTDDHKLLADYCEAAGLEEEAEKERLLVK